MNAAIGHLPTAAGLPRPSSGRMRPLRAGILNIWEYDEQEFWFANGRLILRGQNTAGKSKALELLLPFVLDGDIRSERLDPFGSKAKTMYWNLIDFADRPSAVGYCWVEFGHVDGAGVERYTTCIVGLRAVRSAGKRVETWFAVTPARVGAEHDLKPDGVPLTTERFRTALGERGVYSTAARDHRAAVDHALFGLGPDRYDALIHLLLQLRRPKLSEKLDMIRLGEYLSDALPPLERHRMESLASAFARLDEDTAEIERLEASSAQLHSFLSHYRAHAQIQTRLRADAVRAANTRFDKVTETERLQRAEHTDATSSLSIIEVRRAELAGAIARMNGQLSGLDLSKVHALQEVERRAADAEQHAASLNRRADKDRSDAVSASEAAVQARYDAAQAEQRRDERASTTTDAADKARLGAEHRMHAEQLLTAPERAVVALEGAAGRRRELLLAVRSAAGAANAAQARIRDDDRAHRSAGDALAEAEETETSQRLGLDTARAALAEALDGWASDWLVSLPEGYADTAVGEVERGARPGPGRLLASERAALVEGQVALGTQRQQIGRRRDEADRERRRIEAETDDAPPARPGRPASRPAGCAPLWACLDFGAELDPAGRAGLEAALEASGLLDALVSPNGRLLDPDTLDTWVAVGAEAGSGAPAGTGLTGLAGLVVVPSGPVDAAAVARALNAVGAAGGIVSVDGTWSIGRWGENGRSPSRNTSGRPLGPRPGPGALPRSPPRSRRWTPNWRRSQSKRPWWSASWAVWIGPRRRGPRATAFVTPGATWTGRSAPPAWPGPVWPKPENGWSGHGRRARPRSMRWPGPRRAPAVASPISMARSTTCPSTAPT